MDLSDPTLAEFFLPGGIKSAEVFQIHTARDRGDSFVVRGREWQRSCEARRRLATQARSAEEMADCKSIPVISTLARRRKFDKPVSQRLSDDAARRRIDKELAVRISQNSRVSEEMSHCTFHPVLTTDFAVGNEIRDCRHRSHLTEPSPFHPVVNQVSPAMRRATEYTKIPVYARLSESVVASDYCTDSPTCNHSPARYQRSDDTRGRLNLQALASRLDTTSLTPLVTHRSGLLSSARYDHMHVEVSCLQFFAP